MAGAQSPRAGGLEALGERPGAGAQAGSASSPSPLVQGPGPATRAPLDRRAAGRAVLLCEAVARRPPSARPRRAAERSASPQQPRPLGDPRAPPASPPPPVTVASAAGPQTALPVTPPLPRPPRPHGSRPRRNVGGAPGLRSGSARGPALQGRARTPPAAEARLVPRGPGCGPCPPRCQPLPRCPPDPGRGVTAR